MRKEQCSRLVKSQFSVYFLKGRATSLLSPAQQELIRPIIQKDQFADSFMLFDGRAVQAKVDAWRQALPWVRPYYAVKSNPMSQILKLVTSNGTGLDCASRDEIRVAQSYGLSPRDIVYSNVIKTEKDLMEARALGIELTAADTVDEAEKVKKFAPGMKMLWRISIKEDPARKIVTCFSKKFGDDISNAEEAHARFKQLAELGHFMEGIHFHCGSDSRGSNGFEKAVEMARTCVSVGRQYGHPMRVIDIGGGFPAGPLNDTVLNALASTRNDPLGYSMMAEPGRHFSSDSCHLLTRVIGRRVKGGRVCYHINDSLYHSFNSKIMDGLNLSGAEDQVYGTNEELGRANLFGMTCDGMDVIAEDVLLPELQVGDWLCLSGMGAYTVGPKSEFNGMHTTEKVGLLPEEVGEAAVSQTST